jgi:predicted RecB family nuclease
MAITQEVFEAFLHCPTKSYLRSKNVVGVPSEVTEWRQHQRHGFRESCWEQLRSDSRGEGLFVGTPPLPELESRCYRVIFDYVVDLPEIYCRLHALERGRSARRLMESSYVPVRFVPDERLAPSDKLLVAFDAFAFSQSSGKTLHLGKIVHGGHLRTVTVSLDGLLDKVRAILGNINAQQVEVVPPPLALNNHCPECEYRSRCCQIALEKDDLSMLSNISEREQKRQHDRGIFTVTQLSYTFRPRKRPPDSPLKHEYPLQALAIRKNQVHIVGTPTVEGPGTPVYFDVEGDPDRDFYYLVGIRFRSGEAFVQRSFWADAPATEREMWAECLRTLTSISNPRLIHYGSYETRFLKRMRSRYPDIADLAFLDQIAGHALNLLSVIYGHVYFPTYSNGLKDIATYLGFRWSESAASGLTALAWRSQWEFTHDPVVKEKLLTYNAEDCEAVQKVIEALDKFSQAAPLGDAPKADLVKVDSLSPDVPRRYGRVDFVLPEFERINNAAYWDYQRNKVFLRTSRHLKNLSRRAANKGVHALKRANAVISIEHQGPVSCPNCKSTVVHKYEMLTQTIFDLKFLASGGIKRWVARYSFPRYLCRHCKVTFQQYVHQDKYGTGLCAYVLYQIIEMRIPQNALARSLGELFGITLARGSINRLKAIWASRYEDGYQAILGRIAGGKLIHADETKVEVNGKDAYVWVFTNLEDVAFVFSESRDASTPQTIMRNFHGVLVSDFYAAYDSINCPKQKCLVHLIRDLNDDLRKQPFNSEMTELAMEFAGLVKPMIESVDRFGLKAYHLRRHKSSVNRFFERLSKRDYQTELAVSYKKRFDKNREKLFTFLDHDGVPWNNNNAEHAIKAFVKLRRCIGGKSSAKGIRDFLVLLSISQTCKYRGVRFLDFLRSGHTDVAAFCSPSPASDGAQTMES